MDNNSSEPQAPLLKVNQNLTEELLNQMLSEGKLKSREQILREMEGKWEPEESQTMHQYRAALKTNLRESRIGPFALGPRCSICSRPIQDACDMHEVLVTRGMVQKLPDLEQIKIYYPYNCVLIHHGECHQEAATKAGQRKCVRQLVEFEGYTGVMNWLGFIGDIMRASLNEQRAIVRSVFWAIQHGPSEVEEPTTWDLGGL